MTQIMEQAVAIIEKGGIGGFLRALFRLLSAPPSTNSMEHLKADDQILPFTAETIQRVIDNTLQLVRSQSGYFIITFDGKRNYYVQARGEANWSYLEVEISGPKFADVPPPTDAKLKSLGWNLARAGNYVRKMSLEDAENGTLRQTLLSAISAYPSETPATVICTVSE